MNKKMIKSASFGLAMIISLASCSTKEPETTKTFHKKKWLLKLMKNWKKLKTKELLNFKSNLKTLTKILLRLS